MTTRSNLACASLLALSLVACGGGKGGTGDGGLVDGDGSLIDGDGGLLIDAGCIGIGCPGGVDAAPFDGTCTPGGSQCSNCVDDDGDGQIDGFDIECSGARDNDEGSFGTAIPGDNKDAVNQDCFFDGNSGAGNDGCNIHVCCILGAPDRASCPIGANQYNVSECPPPLGTTPFSQQCIDTCAPLTPPGCDCFGCCTLCDNTGCYTVTTNPATAPMCDASSIADPTKCPVCTQSTSCGSPECGGDTCILCPGQDPADLPASCNMNPTCPTGTTECGIEGACGAGTYCSNGCCIGIIL